jgi:hypothetical protein
MLKHMKVLGTDPMKQGKVCDNKHNVIKVAEHENTPDMKYMTQIVSHSETLSKIHI